MVKNCTFNGNIAQHGNTIACDSYNQNSPSSVQLVNCILWDNANGIWNNDNSTINITYSDVKGGYTGEGNINLNPLFADPNGLDGIIGTEDDNLRLLPGSPCIDAGDSNSVADDLADLDGDGDPNEPIPWDLDGNPRFFDDPVTDDTGVGTWPIVDMGAYEFGKVCGDANHPYPVGDMNLDCEVDISDAVILAVAWLSEDGGIGWNPACDISIPADGIINGPDFAVIGLHWLECTKPECD